MGWEKKIHSGARTGQAWREFLGSDVGSPRS